MDDGQPAGVRQVPPLPDLGGPECGGHPRQACPQTTHPGDSSMDILYHIHNTVSLYSN